MYLGSGRYLYHCTLHSCNLNTILASNFDNSICNKGVVYEQTIRFMSLRQS